jgi:hypothetical protein
LVSEAHQTTFFDRSSLIIIASVMALALAIIGVWAIAMASLCAPRSRGRYDYRAARRIFVSRGGCTNKLPALR